LSCLSRQWAGNFFFTIFNTLADFWQKIWCFWSFSWIGSCEAMDISICEFF
jgi:hypothetical protein